MNWRTHYGTVITDDKGEVTGHTKPMTPRQRKRVRKKEHRHSGDGPRYQRAILRERRALADDREIPMPIVRDPNKKRPLGEGAKRALARFKSIFGEDDYDSIYDAKGRIRSLDADGLRQVEEEEPEEKKDVPKGYRMKGEEESEGEPDA